MVCHVRSIQDGSYHGPAPSSFLGEALIDPQWEKEGGSKIQKPHLSLPPLSHHLRNTNKALAPSALGVPMDFSFLSKNGEKQNAAVPSWVFFMSAHKATWLS